MGTMSKCNRDARPCVYGFPPEVSRANEPQARMELAQQVLSGRLYLPNACILRVISGYTAQGPTKPRPFARGKQRAGSFAADPDPRAQRLRFDGGAGKRRRPLNAQRLEE